MIRTSEIFSPHLPGFTFHDLFRPTKLAELTDRFHAALADADPALAAAFEKYRARQGAGSPEIDVSRLLVAVAPHVSMFIGSLFGVEGALNEHRLRTEREKVIFSFKKEFFVRRVLKKYDATSAAGFRLSVLDPQMRAFCDALPAIPHEDPELEVSAAVMELLEHERFAKTRLPDASARFAGNLADALGKDGRTAVLVPTSRDDARLRGFLAELTTMAEQWLAARYFGGDARSRDWVTFRVPRPLDYAHLVDLQTLSSPVPGFNTARETHQRCRDGFDLTDPRYSEREISGEVEYCIYCHERDKDSCSKGLADTAGFKHNPLGFHLKGCPLGQKISESQLVMSQGDPLGALALITIDNPMVPGTGHRICNDCMKACIYQKQDPVNIPQIETRILTDVLNLPWGFEIYSLLTRWNPLNVRRPHALPYNGLKILIVGLGPAGYTLAHYFLNEGFGVVGIDGLKIEPLPPELVGDSSTPFQAVRDYSAMTSKLSERVLAGFGGVSEYGITVRWDKNFLTVIYLNLMRRMHFRVYDGVRFGGTLTVEDAWTYGFDHVCIAAGAGKPTFVRMHNNLVRGVKMASDFLMALQLSGAGKTDSLSNLQVQLPAVVIGGGLTAIDTATELMAYYPVQVTKIRKRYTRLVERYGKSAVDGMFDAEETGQLRRYLAHAEEIESERVRAASSGETPNFIPLLRKWGGVQIFYRKSLPDSPAYRLNHEEIIKSLEEGIAFVEKMNPREVVSDQFGAVQEVVFEQMENAGGKWAATGREFRVPARTVMIAAGTVPNVMYEREHPGTFALDGRDEFFQAYRMKSEGSPHLEQAREGESAFFTSYAANGRHVTFFGDNHPDFAGNVVKAMASAKEGVRSVLDLFGDRLRQIRTEPGTISGDDWKKFAGKLDDELNATVVGVNRLTPTITEVIVRAPKAAAEFHPGQFYRLQNYEVDSPEINDTLIMMEGIALTGAWVDRAQGLIGLITLEVGASSRMCAFLKPGQHVVVMGPTGSPTEIPSASTVLLLGGGLGNAVLFSIANACRQKGNNVVYFAGYKKKEDLFMRDRIEASADVVVYSVDSGDPIPVSRPQDRTFVGTIIDALVAYAEGRLGPQSILLRDARRIIAIGSDRMMAAVSLSRHGILQPHLHASHTGIVSINSPMQCMMKAICAQCLQRHVDPVTGNETIVFSCVNQDQLMDHVDFANLSARLRANSVMEKISNKWLDYLLEKYPEKMTHI